MNLLADYQTEIETAMGSIFDSFRRNEPMLFYKPSIEEVIIFDNEFNADLEEYHNPNATLSEQFESFEVRVIYPRRENVLETSVRGGQNLQVKGLQELGIVKIQFKQPALDYIGDAIRFTFMGEKYQKLTDVRRIGVSGEFNIFEISLVKVD